MRAIKQMTRLWLIASAILADNVKAQIALSKSLPSEAGQPLPDSFISFAVEFESFPPYSGQTNSPNTYSNNLLSNIVSYAGTKPYFRVGGNSADYALFDPSLEQPVDASQASNNLVYIGPSFFDGFSTLDNARYVFDFNLMKSFSSSTSAQDRTSFQQIVPYVCTGLQDGTVIALEMGNEPDLYISHGYPGFSSATWNASSFVAQWQQETRYVASLLATDCSDTATSSRISWLAPSLFDQQIWTTSEVWALDIDNDTNVSQISGHSYILQSKPTIKTTFLSHQTSINTLAPQINQGSLLAHSDLPFVLDEVGSILPIGINGLTNTFGAALWMVDYSLWAASHNISRLYWQQGLNFPYAAWQPINTAQYPTGTYPPYYANIAVAALLGNTATSTIQVANIAGRPDSEAIYAIYNDTVLSKVAIVNLQEWNYTAGGTAGICPATTYSFQLPAGYQDMVTTQQMSANGTNVLDGITFDGYSYEYDESTLGMPVRQPDIPNGETITVNDGMFEVVLYAGAFCTVNLELA